MRALLLCVLLTGCIEAPPTVTKSEHAICNPDIDDCPGGHPTNCTPLQYCTDTNLQNGTCCEHYGVPTSPTPVPASSHCGTTGGGTPYCIVVNDYTLWDTIICETMTYWVVGSDGYVHQQRYTDCYYL